MDTPSLTPALTGLEEASSVIIIIASSSIGSTTGLIVITSSINPKSTIGFTYLGETTAKKARKAYVVQ